MARLGSITHISALVIKADNEKVDFVNNFESNCVCCNISSERLFQFESVLRVIDC
jgi:hypothetical protein